MSIIERIRIAERREQKARHALYRALERIGMALFKRAELEGKLRSALTLKQSAERLLNKTHAEYERLTKHQ